MYPVRIPTMLVSHDIIISIEKFVGMYDYLDKPGKKVDDM